PYPVAVRREHLGRWRRRVGARIGKDERVRDLRPRSARGSREELAVERDSRPGPSVEPEGGGGPEPRELDRELVARHADAVRGIRAVDGDEEDPPVGQLADRTPRLAAVQRSWIEQLAGVEHGFAVLHEQRAATDGARETAPVGREREPSLDLLPDPCLRRELG